MSYARELLESYPRTVTVDTGALAATSDELTDCAEACTADSDADLSEHEHLELVSASGYARGAPMFVLPPGTSSAARLTTRPASTARCWTPVFESARAAAMNHWAITFG